MGGEIMKLIETNKLKEHHKNGYYFTDIEGEKYEEVKRSIETHGIRDPIKVTRDYTVISGHQRLRIARDLGLTHVPYDMLDVDENEAEYLLIAENVERRGQAETDPIKKARIAKFLKEYWGVREGRPSKLGQNGTVSDISEVIGETERTTKRLLKLNDLIPQLQSLVSSRKLGTTAAEQLAYLSPEVQSALYDALGEEIGQATVTEQQAMRREIEKRTKTQQEEIERLKDELKQQSNNKGGDGIQKRIDELEREKAELALELIKLKRREEDKLTEIKQKADEEKRKLEVEKKKYAEKVREKEQEIAEYERHVNQLLTKIEKMENRLVDTDLSERSLQLMQQQVAFSEKCTELSELVALLTIEIPHDLPYPSREVYLTSLERVYKVVNEAIERFTPEVKIINERMILND